MIKKVKKVKDLDGNVTDSLFVERDDGDFYVPIDPENTDYAEVKRQVEAGELTIAPADEEE